KKAKGFGFTLNEIAEILEMFDMNIATCELMAIKVTEKLNRIDEKIKDLNEMKMMIIDKIEKAQIECIPTSKDNCQNV
ncbi:MAG: MerR family DNA-binding protein, partial [Chlorobi bacterium]|nr:MerR family DNA-binding protein [Chlorobiota bacterium]